MKSIVSSPPVSIVSAPIALLAVILAACLALLCVPFTLPIGPMYWDLVVYIDGAQRILTGQTPSVDFFTPVGPLGYWLFAGGMELFPRAQPLLLAQWSMLVITAPPVVLLLLSSRHQDQGRVLALLIPFLLFQLLPINVEAYSTYPALDGFGIYNRHAVDVLYVLTWALVFERRQAVLFAVVAWCCTALFLSKITGFISAGLLCAFAFAAGRVHLRTALGCVGLFLATLLFLQLFDGVVSAYVASIVTLVQMNEGVLASRFLQAGSIHFGTFASGTLLAIALFWTQRHEILGRARGLARSPGLSAIPPLLDRDAIWLAVALFAGLFFETQNTGGHAFLFLWPILLRILSSAARFPAPRTALVLTLVGATALPPFVGLVHRAARAFVGQVRNVELPSEHLKNLGLVSQRPEIFERAVGSMDIYSNNLKTFREIADQGELPSFTLYSELDFQALWLLTVDQAASAILDYEAKTGIRFETVMSLNFANPFPYILDRTATRHIPIGADPTRAVPPPTQQVLDAVAATDLVLYPICPLTVANERLRKIYEPALKDHELIRLSPCWQAYIRPEFGQTPTS